MEPNLIKIENGQITVLLKVLRRRFKALNQRKTSAEMMEKELKQDCKQWNHTGISGLTITSKQPIGEKQSDQA